MKNNKLVKFLTLFIIIQPFYDIFIYFTNKVLNFNIPFISFIRPIIAIGIYLYLFFSYKVNKKEKIATFTYFIMYAIFCIVHLLNIKNNFFSLSYGTIGNEIRYLCNYGYFLLQLVNFYLIFKITTKEEHKKILMSLIWATTAMALMYFISIVSNTSPKTYIYSAGKGGWRGWSVSAHYIGHVIIYTLPLVIYALFEKKYLNKWYKYAIIILLIIPPFYLVGTKAPLFAVLLIVVFYTILRVITSIKEKKINTDTIFFTILSVILLATFSMTYGYDNFKNQIDVTESDSIGVNLISDNLTDNSKFSEYEEFQNDKEYLSTFENRLMLTLYRYHDIDSSVFDNRTIQKTINRHLWGISPLKDKLFGYGHDDMPNCTWVETDVHTIFYCYGIIGFILILLVPIGYISINGIKCLINIKKMSNAKFLLGFGYGISLFIIYSVGYTIQYAQTVFYLVILFIFANYIFTEKKDNISKKDYLFMINDLNIGGAEVGMVDVVNKLVSDGNKVDIVLLRKRGPLLEKLNKNINIYEILNQDYSKLKQKLYHILYILGGPFTKYVYSHTIKDEYKNEIAYIEGYPAVFISSSTNSESVKIASIRVGLKNHKLKASKIPWGEYLVKKAYQKMDNIYTVSELTTKEFLEKYPFCQNKTRTIYTYFNVDEIKEKSKEKYDYKYDKSKINFLAVGRFNSQKSYDRLIEAFDIVSQKHDNIVLHFLGKYDTAEGNKIIEMIEDKKLGDRVILHGVIENPYPYIKDCDVLISSSLYEGFPRVINEAISLGKLCIGTNVTGTKEALHEGKLGILVEDSIDGLVSGMNKFIENPQIYQKYKAEINKFDGNEKSFFSSFKELTNKRKSMIIYMPKLSYGGMEKALVNLINYAKLNEKYDLTLYLLYRGNMNYLDLLPQNIKLIVACRGEWNLFGKFEAIIKVLIRYVYQLFVKYDIAISYSYQHPILTSLTRFSSENNIVYIHGNLIEGIDPKLLKKRIKHCKYEKFKKIICVSNDAKNALIKLIKRTDNIYVVNNIIDGDAILSRSLEEVNDFKFEKDKIYFINISRHYEVHKKLVRIIESTRRLNDEGYDFEVLFIGDGEDDQLYKEKIKEYNIKNIHLLGKTKNPYKYLRKSSALLLSSVREGYPVVFIESMILNKPIITTDVSDAKEDVDGIYGIVVDNTDEAIYDGMKKFIKEGYQIKTKFNYLEFNKKIENMIDEIYNQE